MGQSFLYKFEDRFKDLIERDNTCESDMERKALFYIIAGNNDLYQKIDYIYDFEDSSIRSECFENEDVDFCSSSIKLLKLGFNLYNGYAADVLDVFSILDKANFNLALEAIRLRFNKL